MAHDLGQPRVACVLQKAPTKWKAQLVHFFWRTGLTGGYAWADVEKLVQFESGAASPELLAKLGKAGAWAVEHAERYLEADTDESDSEMEDDHEVACVCDKRTRAGVAQYKVRWKGYASEDDTWEPVENLSGASGMVAQFDKELELERWGAQMVSVPRKPAGSVPSQTAVVSMIVTETFVRQKVMMGLRGLCELLGLSRQDLP